MTLLLSIQVIFDTFNCQAIYLSTPAVLSLYASYLTTGVVLDPGCVTMHAVPVYEGSPAPHAVECIVIGGRELT